MPISDSRVAAPAPTNGSNHTDVAPRARKLAAKLSSRASFQRKRRLSTVTVARYDGQPTAHAIAHYDSAVSDVLSQGEVRPSKGPGDTPLAEPQRLKQRRTILR